MCFEIFSLLLNVIFFESFKSFRFIPFLRTTAAETTWNYYTNSSYASGTTNFLVDVTNIAKYKVRVRMRADNTIEIYGSSSKNYTFFSFLRLGDT